MRFVYFTDLHATHKCPPSRKEGAEWLNLQVAKVDEIIRYANDQDAVVLFGGDLFDRPDPNPYVVHRLMDSFSKAKRGVIGSYGNHDYQGSSYSNLEETWIGILTVALGNFPIEYPAKDSPYVFKDGDNEIVIRTIHYYKGIEEDLRNPEAIKRDAMFPDAFHILMPHAQITQKPVPWEHITYDDVKIDVDLVLVSDYHPQWGIEQGSMGQLFAAPGSISRMTRGHDDMNRIPSFVFFDTVTGVIEMIPLQCAPDLGEAFCTREIERHKLESDHLKNIMKRISVQGFKAKDPIEMLEVMMDAEGVTDREVKETAVEAVQEAIRRDKK